MSNQIYNSIYEVLEILRKDIPNNPLGTDYSKEEYEWIDCGDSDGGRIMPSMNSSFISPFLFRGQNKRFQPCLPKLYRNYPIVTQPQELTQEQRDKYLISQMQIQEFKYLLKYHPFIEFAKKIGLHINYEGLAQHYALHTDLLDLAQDFETAAFFACCKFNSDGNWEPMSEGNGIIYRVDITRLSEDLFKLFEIVGLNVFPRPGEQKAWSFKMPLGADFEQFGFEEFEFKHDHELSINILEKFNSGNSLFPFDLIADKVDTILNHNSIPLPIAENVLLKHKLDSAEIDIAIERYCERFENQFGIFINNRTLITISENEIIDLNKQIESKKENFLKNVGVRAVKKK